MDIDKLFAHAIKDGIIDGIKAKLSGYNTPLDETLKSSISKYVPQFRELLEGSIKSAIDDESFRDEVKKAVRTWLARLLIQRFGGEMEKQINVLKSDPATRARITLAIEEIVK